MALQIGDLGPLTESAAAYFRGFGGEATTMFMAELDRRKAQNDVLAASLAIKRARAERRGLTTEERQLIDLATRHVCSGVQPPARFAPIPRLGERRHRTMLSLADPGSGHLAVTLADSTLLDGVVVHHEVITRCGANGAAGSGVGPYRMIDIRQNALLRLYAVDDVPVSVYGGRPNYQIPTWHATPPPRWTIARAFRFDPVTPIHVAAAAATAAFANGVADVKFYLGGLTASQAIDFMRGVRSAVDRDEIRQTLSSQFNLNVAVLDDRSSSGDVTARPKRVKKPARIARLATELTAAGGWERVTIDNAWSNIPSTPVLEILGVDGLAAWVEHAHAVGLETYISGGMTASHVKDATRAGVDGVGIGFWIHKLEKTVGGVGEIDGSRIHEAIAARNSAEADIV
jgi:hypothetical protein